MDLSFVVDQGAMARVGPELRAHLRRLITSPRVSDDDLDMIACAFGVSEQVVVHQIRNHKLAELAN